MSINKRYWPGGKTKCLTFSYDDGQADDRQLVEIMNAFGIRGTFHLNSGFLGREKVLSADEVAKLFIGHEISVHTVNHPHLVHKQNTSALREIIDDKEALEKLAEYPVRGMSYPFGTYDDRIISLCAAADMEYARTVISTHFFNLPKRFLEWHPTCHHNEDIFGLADRFLNSQAAWCNSLFYLWGHSFEFSNDGNWDIIERFCELMSNNDDIWYATNIEIVDYVNAVNSIKMSVDESFIYNTAAIPIWVEHQGQPVEIKPGETKLSEL